MSETLSTITHKRTLRVRLTMILGNVFKIFNTKIFFTSQVLKIVKTLPKIIIKHTLRR